MSVKYKIIGEPMPVVACELVEGKSMIIERESMAWMSSNMEMSTNVGSSFGKAFGRIFCGESIFQNTYTAHGQGMIAFVFSFSGSIRAVEINPNRPVMIQKSDILGSETGAELSVFLQKKAGAGFFGGEDLAVQELSGYGTVFLEINDFEGGQYLLLLYR